MKTSVRWSGRLAIAVVSFGLVACGGENQLTHEEKIAPFPEQGKFDRASLERGGRVSILVTLRQQTNLAEAASLTSRSARARFVYNALTKTAHESQGPLLAWLRAKKLSFRPFYIRNMVAISSVTWDDIVDLAERSDVARIAWDPAVRLLPEGVSSAPIRPTENLSEGLQAVGSNIVYTHAPEVWEELGFKGQGIVVAGQDTGVNWQHPSLIHQYRGSVVRNGRSAMPNHDFSWHDAIHEDISGAEKFCGLDSPEPCDDHGHGTHTLGSVVGDDGNGDVIGMAPSAQWIACRNMDAGVGRPSTYIECFEFFLAPYPVGGDPQTQGDPDKAPHVINNSWGCNEAEGCSGDEIGPVMQALQAAGVMTVASAGNEGPSCETILSQPASHSDSTLSVGALDHRSESIAFFSSRGPSAYDGAVGPDVVAPGVSIRSAVEGGFTSMSGTSMAGPHVVGLVALVWSGVPTLIGNIEKTTELVRMSSTPMQSSTSCGGVPGNSFPNNTFGYGSINAYELLNVATQDQTKL